MPNRKAMLEDALGQATHWQECYLEQRLLTDAAEQRAAATHVRVAKLLMECDAHKKARAEHVMEQERLHKIIAQLRATKEAMERTN